MQISTEVLGQMLPAPLFSGCFFGFGSTVVHELTVADETLLGVNSVLLESSVAYGRYLGSPARLMSTHELEGIQV